MTLNRVPVRIEIIYAFSLHSKRFLGVGDRRKTEERNRNGILPARNWGESRNKKEGVGEGKEGSAWILKTSVRQRTELVSSWTSQTLLTCVDHRIKKGNCSLFTKISGRTRL